MVDLSAILPVAGYSGGAAVTFWRVWSYVDKARTAQLAERDVQLKAAMDRISALEAKLDARQVMDDAERGLRQVAQEQAAVAIAAAKGLEATVAYLQKDLDRAHAILGLNPQ